MNLDKLVILKSITLALGVTMVDGSWNSSRIKSNTASSIGNHDVLSKQNKGHRKEKGVLGCSTKEK